MSMPQELHSFGRKIGMTKGNGKERILITGCTGFLGLALLKYYVKKYPGLYNIVGTGRNAAKILKTLISEIEFIEADIADQTQIRKICKNVDVVIHCAALCRPWGKYADHFDVNYLGTAHIVDSCRKHNVKFLIHISSPSVLFPVNRPQTELKAKNFVKKIDHDSEVVDESEVANNYIRTKLMAEKLVSEMQRSSSTPFRAVTLRPRAIFGPGDTTLLPRLLGALKTERFPIIDDGKVIMDLTYIDNVVHSVDCCLQSGLREINAIDTNHSPNKSIFGNVYNVTNDEPVEINWLVNKLCNEIPNLKRPYKRYSRNFLWYVACVVEFIFSLLLLFGVDIEPPITKYTVNVFSRSVIFDISKTKADLKYCPLVNMDAAIKKTVKTLKE